jgi:biopolymer transport protein ExbD
MHGSKFVPRNEIMAKVNVVPIIDVSLVLVIILLVTAPLLTQADLPINLPQAHTREAEDERNVSVTMGSNGGYAVDDRVIQPQQLKMAVAAKLAQPGNQDVLVVVRADSGLPYSAVEKVLTEVRDAGAKRIAIATRQKVEGAP